MNIKKNTIVLFIVLLILAGITTTSANASSDPLIAEIKTFGFNFAPRGWLHADGQLLPISQNTALFSLIGTIYGGDGRNTTALPNLKGRFAMHAGNGPGLISRRLGEKGGTETVTLNLNQLPSHRHTLMANSDSGRIDTPNGNSLAEKRRDNQYDTSAPNVAMRADALSSSGGGGAHENMPPYLSMNFCIAITGVYPPRN